MPKSGLSLMILEILPCCLVFNLHKIIKGNSNSSHIIRSLFLNNNVLGEILKIKSIDKNFDIILIEEIRYLIISFLVIMK